MDASLLFRPLRRWSLHGTVFAGMLISAGTLLPAADPPVVFDVSNWAAFEPQFEPPETDQPLAVGRKWIEVHLELSTWLTQGHPEQLEEVLVEVVDLSGQVQVVDFAPRDETHSEYVGNIAVESKRDQDRSLGLTANSTWDWLGQANAHATLGSKQSTIERYEKKAPHQQIVVSGTTRQGRGVSFRFRQAIDQPLEGSHRLSLMLSVPESFRHSLLRIECAAVLRQKLGVFQQKTSGGRARFLVPLFDRTDPEAQQLAETFVRQREALRRVAQEQESNIRRRAYGDPLQRVGVLLSVSDPDIPTDWLERLLLTGTTADFERYAPRLPEPVRRQGERYLLARHQLLVTPAAPELETLASESP